jgi:predicted MFS family arabinose efflux permease
MRMLTAFAASGVVPIALALVGDLIPYKQRGHALGWLFGGAAAVAALAAVPLFRSEQLKEQQG